MMTATADDQLVVRPALPDQWEAARLRRDLRLSLHLVIVVIVVVGDRHLAAQ